MPSGGSTTAGRFRNPDRSRIDIDSTEGTDTMGSGDSIDTGTVEQDLQAVIDDERRLGQDSARLARDLRDENREVDVTVNNRPVLLPNRHVTGLEVKEAAVVQGVAIEVSFQLFEELGGGRERQIGDQDRIEVHKEARFTAIAPDDNS